MSDNRKAGVTGPEAGPALPSWARPLSAVEGHPAFLLTGTIVFSLSLIYLADVLTPPFTSVGAAAIIPVLAATWFLSGRLVVLVLVLALAFRLAATLGGAVPVVESVTEGLTILLISGLGRVAAIHVTATQEAAARADLMARIARIATSPESLKQILDRILQEMAGEGLRGGLVGLINERNEIYPAAAQGDIDEAVWNSRLAVGTLGVPRFAFAVTRFAPRLAAAA